MATFDVAIMRGVIGDRPAASAATAGRLYISTDEGKIYRDNGSSYDEVPSAAAGSHAAVTLGTDADTVLGLTGQALSLDNQDANKVLAGPTTGAAADPTFRALVAADVGTETPDGTKFLRDDMSWQTVPASHDAVTLSADAGTNLLSLSTQEIGIDDQNANVVFAGPSTGAAAAPAFRALVPEDLATDPDEAEILTVSSGALAWTAAAPTHDAVTLAADAGAILNLSTQEVGLETQDANTVFAGPTTGAAADPDFRALVAADLPAANRTHQALGYVEGEVSAAAGAMRIPNHFGATATIVGVYLDIDTAPTGADLTVDVHKNGTTIFTTQSNRPHIDAGANAGNSTTIEVASWADGAYLTVDVDAVGSTVAGSDLTVTIKFTI